MNITIHRGTHQIGGCITEYEHRGWRIFVDCGAPLPGSPDSPIDIERLTNGDVSQSVLLITHYHGDHIGKLPEISTGVPVYMGVKALEIEKILCDRLKYADDNYKQMVDRLAHVTGIKPYERFSIGPFSITPYPMDHSAYDAYGFLIEAGEASVFHTGDFRSHGFSGSTMMKGIVERLTGSHAAGHVDCLVCEGTNVSRPQATPKTEAELQADFAKAFAENKYNLVYVSSTNIDRLLSLFHASRKARRPFFVDRYQRKVLEVAARDEKWSAAWQQWFDKYVITLHRNRTANGFRVNTKFVCMLEQTGYVIIARANDNFKGLIERLPGENKVRYLSMWDSYVKDASGAAYNPTLAEALGTDYRYMHTSGHCCMEAVSHLVDQLNPRTIIPIHTDNPGAFAKLFCDKARVLQPKDGETVSV